VSNKKKKKFNRRVSSTKQGRKGKRGSSSRRDGSKLFSIKKTEPEAWRTGEKKYSTPTKRQMQVGTTKKTAKKASYLGEKIGKLMGNLTQNSRGEAGPSSGSKSKKEGEGDKGDILQ